MHNLHILPYYRITQANDSLIHTHIHTHTHTHTNIYTYLKNIEVLHTNNCADCDANLVGCICICIYPSLSVF